MVFINAADLKSAMIFTIIFLNHLSKMLLTLISNSAIIETFNSGVIQTLILQCLSP